MKTNLNLVVGVVIGIVISNVIVKNLSDSNKQAQPITTNAEFVKKATEASETSQDIQEEKNQDRLTKVAKCQADFDRFTHYFAEENLIDDEYRSYYTESRKSKMISKAKEFQDLQTAIYNSFKTECSGINIENYEEALDTMETALSMPNVNRP
ncbi:MAG: hypothetical protein MUD14_28105 [Hydrococcus sp. Prado102]|jgi:hypothetical protein|nr:hypothetical protein [Hydrococcus sp. Prado102]